MRTCTRTTASSGSGSPDSPPTVTTPRTVAWFAGVRMWTQGAWFGSVFCTYTWIEVSAIRLPLSIATAPMWGHPFATVVVSQDVDHVHHVPFPDVSVAIHHSPVSMCTLTPTTSTSSHAFPAIPTVPLTVAPFAGSLIRTCGGSSATTTDVITVTRTAQNKAPRNSARTFMEAPPRVASRGGYKGSLERRFRPI